jgi:tRNA pseudouridine55 synthase
MLRRGRPSPGGSAVSGTRRRPGRAVDGIILLDKPEGLSSNQALSQVKHLLGARKAGHTGALDPLATGLLPLCFGEATKVSGWLLDADKSYVAVAELGRVTDTGDQEGRTLSEAPVPRLDDSLMAALTERFTGEIAQVPPMFSALKRGGQPLYRLARKGIEVEREPRNVTIHRLVLRLLDRTHLELEVDCSKGTYIRSLVGDIGQVIGCGATVQSLRRTRHGAFGIKHLWTLEQIRQRIQAEGPEAMDSELLSADDALPFLPALALDESSVEAVRQGRWVEAPLSEGGHYRLYCAVRGFIGVGEVAQDGLLRPKRLFVGADSC